MHDLCNDGRQRGAVQAHIQVLGNADSVEARIQADTQHNGPDIDNVFAEQ